MHQLNATILLTLPNHPTTQGERGEGKIVPEGFQRRSIGLMTDIANGEKGDAIIDFNIRTLAHVLPFQRWRIILIQ